MVHFWGAIYDPLANTWTPAAPPAGWMTIGDAQSVVLANGAYMQANCCTTQAALLDPHTLTWTPTGSGKFNDNNEEGWNLLPNGEVLTVDAYVPILTAVVDLRRAQTGETKRAATLVMF